MSRGVGAVRAFVAETGAREPVTADLTVHGSHVELDHLTIAVRVGRFKIRLSL
jgi:hypothetical protein